MKSGSASPSGAISARHRSATAPTQRWRVFPAHRSSRASGSTAAPGRSAWTAASTRVLTTSVHVIAATRA
ncbi:hypothetical protein [Nonomuraea sp. CA-141351]|uniref:hypothetical protein n=1 Tax=Nonomuraea sp. CA-141351 TaxID=3239996 RepID=UPI003D928680